MTQKVTRAGIEWMMEQGPPEVVVRRTGRWEYHLTLVHGLVGISDRLVWGECHAEKVAARMLRRYERKITREEGYGRRVVTSEPEDA